MHNSFLYMFISILYMFRAFKCSLSGDSIYQCDIWYMSLYVGDRLVCRFGRKPDSHLHRVTYTRYRIETTESPDDEHLNARNMYRIEINIYKKELCLKVVIKQNCSHSTFIIFDCGQNRTGNRQKSKLHLQITTLMRITLTL